MRLPLNGADIFPPPLTPVQAVGGVSVKRDDLYSMAGVSGGKVRTCWALATGAVRAGARGLITAGSRASPQVNIVAHIARALGVPCRVHTPTGTPGPEVTAAVAAGAVHVQHPAGYNSVLISRANADGRARGWAVIPFGMECWEAVEETGKQAANLPDVPRVVVAVGSGMSLAGIVTGLRAAGRATPVLGVVVGADPRRRLDRYAPEGWRESVTLVPSGTDYHTPARVTTWHGLALDPHYEAKCLPYLQPGDLFWCVGIRQTAAP